jgi:hypothetical protein
MARGVLRLSAEYLRAHHLGGLDAAIVGASWDEATKSVLVTLEGKDVPENKGRLRIEQRTSIETKFITDART